MRILISIIFLSIVNCLPNSLLAQRIFWQPEEAFAIEVSLENTDLMRLPIYRNSIQSLAVIDDYIIGGTSAKEDMNPFVFVASLSERKLIAFEDLAASIEGQRGIESGFCKMKDNSLIAGSIPNNTVKDSGHLFQISVDDDGNIDVKDLGVPVKGEGVFTLTCNSDSTMLYGISYPTGKFFSYDIDSGQARLFDDIVPSVEELNRFNDYGLQPENYLGAALIESDQGLIYGSKGFNDIFYFNPEAQTFHILDDKIPEVWGRTSLGQIESWAKSSEGILYGGNAGEGQLFSLDPATNQVKNLGKPIMMNRMPGLAIGADGKLYGIAGGPPGYAHLFSYDSDHEGFYDYGFPQFTMKAPGIEQGIPWRAYNIGAVASSEDGKYIVLGEEESLSQLLIFAVEN